MRKLIAAASIAAFAGILATATPAAARCAPGPRGKDGDTVYLTNPATNGNQYLNVDGSSGQVYVGSTNQARTAYVEVGASAGAGGPSVEVYNYNESLNSDYRAGVSSAGPRECGQLIGV